ncbi:MAG: adaptor protein MecA [Lachnospiraceae bacterium]|nr:adaptor protein MecA [Lachnospiraceae bacterium]
MKIERVSENQIRCTLSAGDLAQRSLKISELAYGTDKAKKLFSDMMQQASLQCGFDAENMPLMIEAIPLNSDSIVLIVTKVEDPEELDTRFSSFAPSVQSQTDDSPAEASTTFEKLLDAIRRSAGSADAEDSGTDSDADGGPGDSFTESADAADPHGLSGPGGNEGVKRSPGQGQARKEADPGQSSKEGQLREAQKIRRYIFRHRLYTFSSLNQVVEAAGLIGGTFRGYNALYANPDDSRYYLTLVFDDMKDVPAAQNVLALLSEYGEPEVMTYAREQYLQEHCKVICPENALDILARVARKD